MCLKSNLRFQIFVSICCHHPETIGHLLWECPLTRNEWALFRGKLHPRKINDLFLKKKILIIHKIR